MSNKMYFVTVRCSEQLDTDLRYHAIRHDLCYHAISRYLCYHAISQLICCSLGIAEWPVPS